MNRHIREGLTYDDVLLVPKHSAIKSRSKDVELQCDIGNRSFNFPVIPANMKTVINEEIALAMIEADGLVILHRFMTFDQQTDLFYSLCKKNQVAEYHVALSVGVQPDDFTNVKNLINSTDPIMLCIDIAHGDSDMCINMIRHIRELSPEIIIIAGNVATGQGAMNLWRAGATAVKVGIGAGSICSTRIETGNGVPQLTALMDVAEARDNFRHNRDKNFPNMHIIADGGLKSAGDCVKALCFADMVMAGNLFAGTDESPGEEVFHKNTGTMYKKYEGSSTYKANHVEGVKAMVQAKGPVRDVIRKLSEGIRSGCSYQGAASLAELRKEPEFIRISNAGLHESHPHSVMVK